jgi:hypothetical protein
VARKTATVLPLSEQLTETEALVGEIVESSGDKAVALAPVPEVALPWSEWPTADFLETRLSHLTVGVNGDDLMLGQTNSLGTTDLGKVTPASLASLASHAAFPANFVKKLSAGTAAAVINERLQTAAERHLTLAVEQGVVANIAREHREMISLPKLADTAWQAFADLIPGALVMLADNTEGLMNLRFGSQRMEKDITTRKGDILQFGVGITYGYGVDLKVSLHTTRLVCLNGMVADQLEWAWRKTTESKAEHQAEWLRARIEEMIPRFTAVVDQARLLADTLLPRNQTIPELIAAFARRHGFTAATVPIVVEHWNRMQDEEEPDQSEWALLNAFSRAVTHDERLAPKRDVLSLRLGAAFSGNEIVTARLRRSIAERLKVEIIPD